MSRNIFFSSFPCLFPTSTSASICQQHPYGWMATKVPADVKNPCPEQLAEMASTSSVGFGVVHIRQIYDTLSQGKDKKHLDIHSTNKNQTKRTVVGYHHLTPALTDVKTCYAMAKH